MLTANTDDFWNCVYLFEGRSFITLLITLTVIDKTQLEVFRTVKPTNTD